MASETIGVGVVGLGFMGTTHLRQYSKLPHVRIVAVCDAVRIPDSGKLSQVAGNLGGDEPLHLDWSAIRATRRFEDLLVDPEVELVDLCVPTPLHADMAIAALEAGKHVVCEKPLARTAALAHRIADVAERVRVFFLPAMCIRFWPEYAWLKEAISSGRYGRVRAARFRRVSEPPGWSRDFLDGSKSGGALLDLHIHDVDFVQFCFGKPRAVMAVGGSWISGAVDHVVALYKVASGAVVSAEGGWCMTRGFGFHMGFTVQFERATVDYDVNRGPEALKLFEEGQPPRVVKCEGPDGYYGELSYMVECIRSGRRPERVTAREAAVAVEICEAEERSIQTGSVVEL